jgi:hypothetical protein
MKPLFGVVVAVLMTVPGWNVQERHPAIALISKVVKDVERRDSATTVWIKALPATELAIGCELRTHDGSFVLITFGDGSHVAVRSQSVIKILGNVSDGKIQNRGVFIERGLTIFNLKDQQTGAFRIVSPVSVASIRKGEGGFSFDPGTSEAFLNVGSGAAEFSSTRIDCKRIVRSGQSATIDSTGCKGR